MTGTLMRTEGRWIEPAEPRDPPLAGQTEDGTEAIRVRPGRRHADADHVDLAEGVLPAPGVTRVAFYGRSAIRDQCALVRQVRVCRRVLPANAVIVASFYDIGSGLLDPVRRGRDRAHDVARSSIPSDGGLPDLLAEAERPDRRFEAVICASIDRIARSIHLATGIERRLDQAGVRLLTADEPFPTTTRISVAPDRP